MRTPKYLSPTSAKLWSEDREEFYARYLADERQPREPQNHHMAIGSAFDAYCKSYLHEALFGKGADPRYNRDTLFEEQVESQCRDLARRDASYVFEAYCQAGCLSSMLLDLSKAIGDPRFEFTINDTIDGVPLLGKPDIFFINEHAARVILDWKVNGYYSKRLKSPMKGYIRLMPGNKIHRDCHLLVVDGVMINAAMYLEEGDKGWADQLSIYSWLLGEPVGSTNMLVGIDQICGPADRLRFATHRLKISNAHQNDLMMYLKHIWQCITTGHIFDELTLEESQRRCELLDKITYDEEFEACF